MPQASGVPLSILDLSPIAQGGTIAQAFSDTKALAQHADRLGFQRYWMAEHHSITGVASSATSVLVGYIAQATSTIRVGAGGIMLFNHAPLIVAELFGTLATLYPNRIDLGVGRAPGTDHKTMQALRRRYREAEENFSDNVIELQGYFADEHPSQRIKAIPGQGMHVPIWLLGSSLYSAQLAANLGLRFAFAAHFAPMLMHKAVALYREAFRPSAELKAPYVMICVNAVAADTRQQAMKLYTSVQQHLINLLRGMPSLLPAPVSDIHTVAAKHEIDGANHFLKLSVVGDKTDVRNGLQQLITETGADEIMINGHIFDRAARLRSFELIADIRADLMTKKQ